MGIRGFTLVELTITVAIAAALVVVGVPTYKKFIAKSRQAEAKLRLGEIKRLAEAWASERPAGLYPDALDMTGLSGQASFSITGFGVFVLPLLLVSDLMNIDMSTPTSCQRVNSLAFEIDDCSKLAYYYMYIPTNGNGFRAYAIEASNYVASGNAAILQAMIQMFSVTTAGNCSNCPPELISTRRVYKGCADKTLDVWMIDQTGVIVHIAEPEC